jgi:hypothetical protein
MAGFKDRYECTHCHKFIIDNMEKTTSSSEDLQIISDAGIEKNKINSIIEYGEKKIKQITRRISEKEVKLESMESHSDYEYNDLLREYTEVEKEHKMDLKLFVELFDKYKIAIK